MTEMNATTLFLRSAPPADALEISAEEITLEAQKNGKFFINASLVVSQTEGLEMSYLLQKELGPKPTFFEKVPKWASQATAFAVPHGPAFKFFK